MRGFESPKYLVRHRLYYFHEVVMSRIRLRILSNRQPGLDRFVESVFLSTIYSSYHQFHNIYNTSQRITDVEK
jgi:hypothetical protein